MESNDVLRLKEALENEIYALIKSFENDTGLSISDIEIERIDITNLSDKRKRYATGGIVASIGKKLSAIKGILLRVD